MQYQTNLTNYKINSNPSEFSNFQYNFIYRKIPTGTYISQKTKNSQLNPESNNKDLNNSNCNSFTCVLDQDSNTFIQKIQKNKSLFSIFNKRFNSLYNFLSEVMNKNYHNLFKGLISLLNDYMECSSKPQESEFFSENSSIPSNFSSYNNLSDINQKKNETLSELLFPFTKNYDDLIKNNNKKTEKETAPTIKYEILSQKFLPPQKIDSFHNFEPYQKFETTPLNFKFANFDPIEYNNDFFSKDKESFSSNCEKQFKGLSMNRLNYFNQRSETFENRKKWEPKYLKTRKAPLPIHELFKKQKFSYKVMPSLKEKYLMNISLKERTNEQIDLTSDKSLTVKEKFQKIENRKKTLKLKIVKNEENNDGGNSTPKYKMNTGGDGLNLFTNFKARMSQKYKK